MIPRWQPLNLQTKITMIVVIIVTVSAVITEWLESRYIQHLVEENVRDVALAVGKSIDRTVTSTAYLTDREARTKELDKIVANQPDLVDIVLYAFPNETGDDTTIITSSGPTEMPRQNGAPDLVRRVRTEQKPLIDYSSRKTTHRVYLAAPIFLRHAVVGSTYAEFSTLQMDDALDAMQRTNRNRRIITGLAVVFAINLFLYINVHRPLHRVLSAIEDVSGGTLTAEVPVERQDELGELSNRFNLMVKTIGKATEDNARLTESLRTMNDSLQSKVFDATAEVMQTNRELAQANQLLSAAQRDLARSQRLSAIGQMAATVAHKIGTPLTALSGHIQLMAEDRNLGAESRQRLQTVESQIERTSKIIQDMLLYARRPEPVRAPLDLNTCIRECIVLFRLEFERRNVSVMTKWNHHLDKIQADSQQLQEVFINLIENALDAMPAGGTLMISVSPHTPHLLADQRSWVSVEFADTGFGMDAEQLSQIFQPFFTTKKAGRGTGLGLAIALETVRAHGGQIDVESEPGKGSRFMIVLPVDGGAR